jgi:hypothetical protein
MSMTSADNGVKVDHDSLQSMATDLRGSTDELTAAAHAAPPMPQVSTSADKVGHTLSEITKMAAGLIAFVEDTAGKIDASDGSYGQADNTSAEELQRQRQERQGQELGPD